jgi:hypothetical protein
MNRILIYMDGGVIQGIAAGQPVEIYIADYDIDGVDSDHPHLTEFGGNECLLFEFEPGINRNATSRAAEIVNKRRA